MDTIQSLIAGYGYLAVSFILFLDSVGIPLPTEASLLLAGAMIRTATFSAPRTLLAALIGASVGSFISYWLGRRAGDRLLRAMIRLFRVPEKRAEQMQEWFMRYGNRAVLFARFIPFVRCLIGYPAGVMKMPLINYMVYTLIGYAGWICFSLLLGYGGMHVFTVLDLPLQHMAAVLIGAIVVWLIVRKVRRRTRQL